MRNHVRSLNILPLVPSNQPTELVEYLNGLGQFLQNLVSDDFLKPRKVTTVEREAFTNPEDVLFVYDTTLNKLCFYNGSAWRQLDDSVIP